MIRIYVDTEEKIELLNSIGNDKAGILNKIYNNPDTIIIGLPIGKITTKDNSEYIKNLKIVL